jgi:hypothetical protein
MRAMVRPLTRTFDAGDTTPLLPSKTRKFSNNVTCLVGAPAVGPCAKPLAQQPTVGRAMATKRTTGRFIGRSFQQR